MKLNTKKIIAASLVGAVALAGAFADDFDFGSDDFSFGGSDSASPVTVGGKLGVTARDYVSADHVETASDTPVDANVKANVTVEYSGDYADAKVDLDFNAKTVKDHPEDVINELSAGVNMGNFRLEAGKMKTIWGKGDKLHVIDNFNADDYTDFIIPDYVDRRISTPMVKATYNFNYNGDVLSNMKLEGIYTPFLPVDRFANTGRWTPAQVSKLTGSVKQAATKAVSDSFADYTTATATVGGAGAALQVAKKSLTAAEGALATATEKKTAAEANVKNVMVNYVTTKYMTEIVTKMAGGMTKEQAVASTIGEHSDEIKDTGAYTEAYAAAAVATGAVQTAELTKTQYAAAVKEASAAYDTAKTAAEKSGAAYMYALTNANALNADPSMIYPDTNKFEYGQAGARLTGSLGPVDLGLSYYYGHYKQPSVNYNKMGTYLTKYLSNQPITEEDKFLAYDQKQTFGAEFATVLWHFNVRGEGAYNLTKDTDGSDPFVHNNSVQWLGGFDIDLPFWNANLNVQETGTYILNNDKITGTYEKCDADYNVNGYTDNKVVANLTTSFANEKVAPEVTVMYAIESGDVVVMPKIAFKPAGEVTLTASGMYLWCKDDNSQFKAWDKNNFVQLGAEINF